MIGRDGELRRLAQLASAREPAVAIIAGEPGIGKTRLVHELLATVPAETVVLVGQAEPGSLARPYEVLLDAIDGRPEVDEEQLAALADARRSPVERLHTGLAILADLIGDSPRGHRLRGPALGRLGERGAVRADRRPARAAAAHRHLPAGRGDPPPAGRRPAGPAGAPARRHPRTPGSARPRRRPRRCWRRPPALRRRCAPRRRCTTAPAATRSSSRSCCARCPGTTWRRWSSSRCRGASPRCCAARSTTSTRSATASSRRPPCSATASRSTCSPP